MEILRFKPVYKDYIWGGTKMKEKFGVKADISPLAESWILSSHPDGMSVIDGGEYDGLALAEYIKKNPHSLGSECRTEDFPILIKFIDAADNLSVQVHPDDEFSKKWENQYGKTELWYVMEKDEGAKITYGLKEDMSKEELADAIKNGVLEEYLNSVPSEKGDVFFVEAGTIHAIGAGNFIVEIQQNSNVTYRLYDYGRIGKDGKPRPLHIEKGVAAANTKKVVMKDKPLMENGRRTIGECEYFKIEELESKGEELELSADNKSYHALIHIEGELMLDDGKASQEIKTGECLFIPAGAGKYKIKGKGKLLLVTN